MPCLGATFYRSWNSSAWSPVSLAQRTPPLKNLPPSPGNYKRDVSLQIVDPLSDIFDLLLFIRFPVGGHSHLEFKKARKRDCLQHLLLSVLQIPLRQEVQRRWPLPGDKKEQKTPMALVLAEFLRSKNKTQVKSSVKSCLDPCRSGCCKQHHLKSRKGQLKAVCTAHKCVLVWINKGNRRQPKGSQAGTVTQGPRSWLCKGDDVSLTGWEVSGSEGEHQASWEQSLNPHLWPCGRQGASKCSGQTQAKASQDWRHARWKVAPEMKQEVEPGLWAGCALHRDLRWEVPVRLKPSPPSAPHHKSHETGLYWDFDIKVLKFRNNFLNYIYSHRIRIIKH